MAYTELYVTDDVGASAVNGGSGIGLPKVSSIALNNIDAVQTSGATHTLENKDNDGWSTTAVGDFLIFDTTGAKKWCYVLALAVGGDADIISVFSMSGVASIAATGKGVNVGGAWTIAGAATCLSACGAANWYTSLANPCLNIQAATYTLGATAAFGTNNWSALIPLRIEAYSASARDLDHWVTTTRAIFAAGASNYNLTFGQSYVEVRGIAITGSYAGTWLGLYSSVGYVIFLNCAGTYSGTSTGRAISPGGTPQSYFRCRAERTAAGTGNCFTCSASSITFDSCEAIGPGTGASHGGGFYLGGSSVMRNCVARGCTTGVELFGTLSSVINCTVVDNVTGILFDTSSNNIVSATILNCKIAYNSGNGIDTAVAGPTVIGMEDFNEFYSNGADLNVALLLTRAAHDVTGTQPFRDHAGGDFRPAFAALGNGTGFPGMFASGGASYTGLPDRGALAVGTAVGFFVSGRQRVIRDVIPSF